MMIAGNGLMNYFLATPFMYVNLPAIDPNVKSKF